MVVQEPRVRLVGEHDELKVAHVYVGADGEFGVYCVGFVQPVVQHAVRRK